MDLGDRFHAGAAERRDGVASADDGTVLQQAGIYLGRATNNVAARGQSGCLI